MRDRQRQAEITRERHISRDTLRQTEKERERERERERKRRERESTNPHFPVDHSL